MQAVTNQIPPKKKRGEVHAYIITPSGRADYAQCMLDSIVGVEY